MKSDETIPLHEGAGGYRCRGRVWVEGEEGTFLGFGRITLLERIDRFGSIAQAARSMEMSYKHAWNLVDSMNRQAGEPLVVKSTGGKRGGGTTLTVRGKRAITVFRSMDERLRSYLAEESKRFVAELGQDHQP